MSDVVVSSAYSRTHFRQLVTQHLGECVLIYFPVNLKTVCGERGMPAIERSKSLRQTNYYYVVPY